MVTHGVSSVCHGVSSLRGPQLSWALFACKARQEEEAPPGTELGTATPKGGGHVAPFQLIDWAHRRRFVRYTRLRRARVRALVVAAQERASLRAAVDEKRARLDAEGRAAGKRLKPDELEKKVTSR